MVKLSVMKKATATAIALALLCAAGPFGAAAEAHPVALEMVKPGREGLELTARLTEDSPIIEGRISWTVRSATGKTVYDSESGSVDISVPPGDYVVDAAYGAASVSSTVSLPRGSRLMVSFVLNAGGLSVESKMDSDALPPARPRVRVFALDGADEGQLVAASADAGEIIRLPAGRYRVESRLAAGNAAAVTDVSVKPGVISKVGITVKAGLARLSFVGSPSAKVTWAVEDSNGARVALRDGLTANLLLTPGHYKATAAAGGEMLTATFRIGAGQTRDILLGN
jgi:hypothetical protein